MRKLLLSMMMLGATMLLKAQNPYPVVPIDTLQFVSQVRLDSAAANTFPDYVTQRRNPTFGDTVRFEGVVAMNPKIYGLDNQNRRRGAYVQRVGGGPWSGILANCDAFLLGRALPGFLAETKFYDNMVVGYTVKITGVIADFNGETQINLLPNNPNWENSVEQVSLTPQPLVYTNIQANQLMTGNPNTTWVQQKGTAEQYEGTLVNITNVTVYNIQQSGNRTFWSVIDDFGNVLDIRDASAYFRRDDNEDTIPKIPNTFQPPAIGTRLEYIRGIVTEYRANNVQRYGIIPIHPSDVGPCNICPPKITNIVQTPTVANSTDSVTISATITSDTTFSSVTLNYNATGTNVFTAATMEETSTPNVFAAKIPAFTAGTVVKYFVRAINSRNLRTVIPDTLATNSNYLVTDGVINNIRTLQFSASSSGATIWDGDSLIDMEVRGVVTATNFNAGATRLLTIQDGTGANSAIFIQRSVVDDVTLNWREGDSVEITSAVVRETFNITTLNNIRATIISRNNALPSFEETLSIDSFAASNRVAHNRKWEGVLVKWNNAFVTNINPDAPSDNGEWSVNVDSTKLGMRIDDMSISLRNINDTITRGQLLNFVQGPMYFSFGFFKLIPRSLSDIDMCNMDTSKPSLNLLGNTIDSLIVGDEFIDAGATSSDTRDGNLTNRIMVAGEVNTDSAGTYTLYYTVTDFCGNKADTLMRTVFVDSLSVSVIENELDAAVLNLYPNPATDNITIDAKFIKTQPVTIMVLDVLGRELVKRTYTQTAFTDVINTSTYNTGVYFCTISNASGSKTLKFMVSGK